MKIVADLLHIWMEGCVFLVPVSGGTEYLAFSVFRPGINDQYRDHILACIGVWGDRDGVPFIHSTNISSHNKYVV